MNGRGSLFRSKAPLRLGLAGGGTDVSPYSEIYGGAVLNATITMYAYATVEPKSDGKIILNSIDRGTSLESSSKEIIKIEDPTFVLHKGVYNRIAREFVRDPLSFQLTTYVEAHPGSGLGTSSTLVVAMVGAFVEWLGLPLGEYDIARLAYEIERIDLNMAGGKQDQYAATFGGFNFMEFHSQGEKVIVNPLRIKQEYLYELEFNTVLYQTGTSRISSKIIEDQSLNVIQENKDAIEAMHQLKEQAILMKEAILKGNLAEIGPLLDFGWNRKKRTAASISNPTIDEIYETALKAGSTGGKISGAGGGGYMMFYCPGNTRYKVVEALHERFGGEFRRFQFAKYGLTSWQTTR
ncbi:MAG: dehydrogenase [Bacteroidetes bacterium]|nr:dehydrogenase [Bacteroidota bacterium]